MCSLPSQLYLNYLLFLRSLAAASTRLAQEERERVILPRHVDAAAEVCAPSPFPFRRAHAPTLAHPSSWHNASAHSLCSSSSAASVC